MKDVNQRRGEEARARHHVRRILRFSADPYVCAVSLLHQLLHLTDEELRLSSSNLHSICVCYMIASRPTSSQGHMTSRLGGLVRPPSIIHPSVHPSAHPSIRGRLFLSVLMLFQPEASHFSFVLLSVAPPTNQHQFSPSCSSNRTSTASLRFPNTLWQSWEQNPDLWRRKRRRI